MITHYSAIFKSWSNPIQRNYHISFQMRGRTHLKKNASYLASLRRNLCIFGVPRTHVVQRSSKRVSWSKQLGSCYKRSAVLLCNLIQKLIVPVFITIVIICLYIIVITIVTNHTLLNEDNHVFLEK